MERNYFKEIQIFHEMFKMLEVSGRNYQIKTTPKNFNKWLQSYTLWLIIQLPPTKLK